MREPKGRGLLFRHSGAVRSGQDLRDQLQRRVEAMGARRHAFSDDYGPGRQMHDREGVSARGAETIALFV